MENDETEEFFKALKEGKIDNFKKLVSSHSYLEMRDQEGFTLLHRAAQNRNPMFAKILLLNGADIESRARWRFTPLHEAAQSSNVCTTKVLLEFNARTEVYSDWGETPLVIAAQVRCVGVIKLLLNNGAYPKEKNKRGQNPLQFIACRNQYRDLDKQLLKIFLSYGVPLESTFGQLTALQYAVRSNKFEIVKLLVENGANVNVYDEEGRTPLHQAVLDQDYDMVKLLLVYRSNPNQLTRNNSGVKSSPLHLAVGLKNKLICKLLIFYDADVYLKNSEGLTSLDIDKDLISTITEQQSEKS